MKPLTILFCAVALVLAASACGPRELEPYGEVVVTVDTDAPWQRAAGYVPLVAQRLRVDLYREDGTWLDSRDLARPESVDWPVSFSLFIHDEQAAHRGLLRLRAYPEGKTRDYRGERFLSREPLQEPFVPTTLEQACSSAPWLDLPGTRIVRRGRYPLTAPVPQEACPLTTESAAKKSRFVNSLRVRVAQPGRYRFGILSVYPPGMYFPSDTMLFLRSSCSEASSQLACNDDLGNGPDPLHSELNVDLVPGEYSLFLSGSEADRVTDFTLRGALAQEWENTEEEDLRPRLVQEGVDITPQTEPHPLVTLDRVVPVSLEPGKVQRASVLLRTACLGTMARVIDPASGKALSCKDQEGELVEVNSSVLDTAETLAQIDRQNSPLAVQEDCPSPSESAASAVCVPAGAFFLGSPAAGPTDALVSAMPERVAVVSRFWLDRREVTVGRYRKAIEQGLPLPAAEELIANPNALGVNTNVYINLCTWSAAPLAGATLRENYALSCISWRAARAFCQYLGGDLPTEAQWEYAASTAGRREEHAYPWGGLDSAALAPDQVPSCSQAVFGRFDKWVVAGPFPSATGFGVRFGMPLPFSFACRTQGACSDSPEQTCPFGVLAANAPENAQFDSIPGLGIQQLGGNVAEYVLDDLQPFDSTCWRNARLRDPRCWSEEAPLRAVRGGAWALSAAQTRTAQRLGALEGALSPLLGFRCAYPKQPNLGD